MRKVFLLAQTCVVLKFHDDPMVNGFEIVVFLRLVWWAAGKRKGFERRRGKTKMRKRRGIVRPKKVKGKRSKEKQNNSRSIQETRKENRRSSDQINFSVG